MKKQIAIAGVIFAVLVGASVMLVLRGKKPTRRPVVETIRSVKAITAETCVIQPRATGYGEAQPDKSWTAIPQISGRIVWVSERLENGEFVAKDEELLRIDETEYNLEVSSCRAHVKKMEASIKEKNTNKDNLERRRELLRKVLALSEKNLERQRSLHASKTISSSSLEQEEINVLQQRNTLANLESELDLVPAQLASLEAELKAAQIALEQAELNLSYARIRAPFAGRISGLTAEIDQYAAKGNALFKVDSIGRAEIVTSLSVEQLAIIARGSRKPGELKERAAAAFDAKLSAARAPSAPKTEKKAEEIKTEGVAAGDAGEKAEKTPARAGTGHSLLRDELKIQVSAVGGGDFVWNGKFLRFGAEIDTDTRMVTLIVAVDDPYKHTPGKAHIPLNKGLFCKVDFYGIPQPELVLPRSALHDGNIYVAVPAAAGQTPVSGAPGAMPPESAAWKLEIRPVKVKYALDRFAIIEGGLRPGETVITSDVVPAVDGMKINPVMSAGFYETVKTELGERK